MESADPDLGEFIRLSTPKRQVTCQVREAIEELSQPESLALVAALEHDPRTITNKAIQVWLESRGYKIIWQRVKAHRKNECPCGR